MSIAYEVREDYSNKLVIVTESKKDARAHIMKFKENPFYRFWKENEVEFYDMGSKVYKLVQVGTSAATKIISK